MCEVETVFVLFQWNQDCLAYLLRLMNQFSITQTDTLVNMEDVFDTFESPRKRMKRYRGMEKLMVPKLNEVCFHIFSIIQSRKYFSFDP